MIDASKLSYPDFVGLTGQENAPPTGRVAYDFWIREASVTEASICLDLACSTGLTSRQLAVETGCSGIGIDMSSPAINEARRRADVAGLVGRISFICADAAALPFSAGRFSHIAVGSSFGFISAREQALAEAARVLTPDGALLVACRHYIAPPPSELLDAVAGAISYRPDPKRDYDWWQQFFRAQFKFSRELHVILPNCDVEVMTARLIAAMDEPDHPLANATQAMRTSVVERFRTTRELLAAHDAFQGLTLMCWWR